MALEFMEGFDSYANTTEMLNGGKWASAPGFIVAGRFGGSAYRPTGASWAITTLPGGSKATRFYGFAIKFNALGSSHIFFVGDTGTTHVLLSLQADGTIIATRSGVSLGLVTTFAVSVGVWYYFELKITIDDTAGEVILKIDGVTRLNGTGLDTRNGVNSSHNQFALVEATNGCSFDDLYVLNTDGSTNNTWIGEKRIETKLPDGAGNYAQFTPSAGANWQNVDETTPDDDTTYNSSGTVGHRDSFTFADFTVPGTISGVQVNVYARKDDAAVREMKPFLRRSGADSDGAAQQTAAGYRYHSQIWETDPNTSSAWSLANLNATEFGYKVES